MGLESWGLGGDRVHVGDKKGIGDFEVKGLGRRQRLSRPEVGSLLIEVTLDHRDGVRRMLPYKFGGQAWERGEATLRHGMGLGGQAWGAHGSMHEGNSVGDGGGSDSRVDNVIGCRSVRKRMLFNNRTHARWSEELS